MTAVGNGVRDGEALFSGGLGNLVSLADLKLNRLLDTFDQSAGTGQPVEPESFPPTRVAPSVRLRLDLRGGANPPSFTASRTMRDIIGHLARSLADRSIG